MLPCTATQSHVNDGASIGTRQLYTPISITMRRLDLLALALLVTITEAAFTCDGGSRTIDDSHVDDEYCDCEDGTDEAKTGACPGTRFHCPCAPHQPREVFASRVNDGVCDCCDGSDEWKAVGVRCPNTCVDLAKADLAVTSKASLTRAQRELRGQKAAADRKAQREAALAALGSRSGELDARRTAKAAAEEAEAAARTDRESRLAAGEVEAALRLTDLSDELLPVALARLAIAKHVSSADALHEKLSATSVSDDMDDVDSADLIEVAMEAKEASQAWHEEGGDDDEKRAQAPEACAEAAGMCGFEAELLKLLPLASMPRDELQRTLREFAEETDQMPALTKATAALLRGSPGSAVDEAALAAALQLLEPFQFEAADQARAALTELEASLAADNATLVRLEPFLALEGDFGEQQEWYALHSHCFTTHSGGFEYRFCPFDTISQGGRSLGSYRGWEQPAEDERALWESPNTYKRVMAFDGGEPCDGTPRRARILFDCGEVDKLLSVTEPKTCVYEARFSTPSACSTDAIIEQHHALAAAAKQAGLPYEPDESVKEILSRT